MTEESPTRAAAAALLDASDGPGSDSLDQLVPAIYDELRQLARRHRARELGEATVQTTELVHEAYLRLVDDSRVTRRGRAYFFAAAARAMRQVLVDAARRRRASKRGGGQAILALETNDVAVDVNAYSAELLDLDSALQRLELLNPRQVRVVECRYFGGMNVPETAAALGVSHRTVEYDWALARAWLFEQLKGQESKGT